MSERPLKIDTKIIHAGEPQPRPEGAVSMPIYQSSTYESRGETRYHELKYIRLNNTPNHAAVGAKIAALEHAEAALVASSGMAAITTTLLTVLKSGDHLLAHNCLYGGTHDFITQDFASFGLDYTLIDAADPTGWASAVRPGTRAIYVESMTNPLLQVADLKAVVTFAREHGLISMIDNTFATPINFRPIEVGFDLVLHSGTKYLNGHHDIVAGVVAGTREWEERIRHKLNHFGGSLDPHACFLLHRGLKTLGVRVRHQNEAALTLAQFLESQPEVVGVNYPGLASNCGHDRARELFSGFGGMLSFELRGGAVAARKCINHLKIPIDAPSLGGVETLVTIPAESSHSAMNPEDRRQLGVSDGLIRVSVGLEDIDDLIEDFKLGLRASSV